MQANKIEAGKVYEVTVGKNVTTMRVLEVQRRVNGQIVFDCVNVKTNKRATVSDADRFRNEVKPEKKTSNPIGSVTKQIIAAALGIGPGSATKKEQDGEGHGERKKERGKGGKRKGTMSGLDAAARVLAESTEPLNVKRIAEKAVALGWAPEGKTPSATLAAALIREIAQKGEASRFARVGKGLFARK